MFYHSFSFYHWNCSPLLRHRVISLKYSASSKPVIDAAWGSIFIVARSEIVALSHSYSNGFITEIWGNFEMIVNHLIGFPISSIYCMTGEVNLMINIIWGEMMIRMRRNDCTLRCKCLTERGWSTKELCLGVVIYPSPHTCARARTRTHARTRTYTHLILCLLSKAEWHRVGFCSAWFSAAGNLSLRCMVRHRPCHALIAFPAGFH